MRKAIIVVTAFTAFVVAAVCTAALAQDAPATRPATQPAAAAGPKLPTRAVGVPLDFDGVPFEDVLTFLRAVADVPVTFDEKAFRAAGVDPAKLRRREASMKLDAEASIGDVLKTVTGQIGPGVAAYVTGDGRIVFTTPADLAARRDDWAADPDAAIKQRAGE